MARILVVDDDAQIRGTLSELIEILGHDVAMTANGREALQYIAAQKVDLMLLDIFMPEQDGFETILRISDRADCPTIIAISGGSRKMGLDFVLSITRKLPVEDILLKPISFEALGVAIEKALAARIAPTET
jgi:CheY-like chemotaxis protein